MDVFCSACGETTIVEFSMHNDKFGVALKGKCKWYNFIFKRLCEEGILSNLDNRKREKVFVGPILIYSTGIDKSIKTQWNRDEKTVGVTGIHLDRFFVSLKLNEFCYNYFENH